MHLRRRRARRATGVRSRCGIPAPNGKIDPLKWSCLSIRRLKIGEGPCQILSEHVNETPGQECHIWTGPPDRQLAHIPTNILTVCVLFPTLIRIYFNGFLCMNACLTVYVHSLSCYHAPLLSMLLLLHNVPM